jgi:hypothetical protein
LGNGLHNFYAKAYDALGNTAYSGTNQVSVNNVVTTPGGLQWVKSMPCLNGNGVVTGTAVDHAGNVVVAGYFNGTINFGTGPISSTFANDVTDAFLAKYTPQGTLIWLKHFGGVGNDAAKALAIDSQNNIFVVGNFQNTVDFGGGAITAVSSIEMFVVKYASSGSYVWANHYSGLTSDVGASVAVDGSDNVVVLADCGYNANFGGVPMSPAGGAADIDAALGKLSGSTGAVIWAKRFGGVNWENARAVAVDSAGDIAVTGYVLGSTDLGGGTISAGGSYDIFLAKYAGADGSYRWGKVFGGPGGDYGYGVTVDPASGNVIMTGLFAGTVDFGGGSIGTSGGGGVFVAGFTGSGTYLWAKTTGGAGDSGSSVKADANGNLVVAGRASSALYFGGSQSLFGNGQVNCFVATFTLSGNSSPTYRWMNYFGTGTDGSSNGNAVAMDSTGQVIVGGSYMATVDFGGTSFTAGMAGYSSAFLGRYTH